MSRLHHCTDCGHPVASTRGCAVCNSIMDLRPPVAADDVLAGIRAHFRVEDLTLANQKTEAFRNLLRT